MKKNFFYSLLCLTLLIVSSCSKSELPKNDGNGVQLTANIASMSSEETSSLSDTPSIFGLFAENSDLDYYLKNLEFSLVKGVMVPLSEGLEYPEGEDEATLYAYAPRTENLTGRYFDLANLDVEVNQKEKGLTSSDFVWGKTTISKGGESNAITFDRVMSKIKVKLTPKVGLDLNNADVSILSMPTTGQLNLQKGLLTAGYELEEIAAHRVDETNFEALIFPHFFNNYNTPLIKVVVDGKTLIFKQTDPKRFESGVAYQYNLTLNDVPKEMPKIGIIFNGSPLGDSYSPPATGETKSVTVTCNPAGLFLKMKIRNRDGGECWATATNIDYSNKDHLYEGISYATLSFHENFGEARSMDLEFYLVDNPAIVYRTIKINQAASSAYLTLGSNSFAADRFGTVYDTPIQLSVNSNRAITMASKPDWVVVDDYVAGAYKENLKITVKENGTGAPRSGTIQFTAGGIKKEYTITQSIAENATFKLKYELNLEFTTSDNKFRDANGLYVGRVTIFSNYPDEFGDGAAVIETDYLYGYVVDAPNSFNRMVVKDFRHPYFFVKNYSGAATQSGPNDTSISSSSVAGGQTFCRQIRYQLPIPANVKRNQKVIFDVKVEDVVPVLNEYGKVTITPKVINQ